MSFSLVLLLNFATLFCKIFVEAGVRTTLVKCCKTGGSVCGTGGDLSSVFFEFFESIDF